MSRPCLTFACSVLLVACGQPTVDPPRRDQRPDQPQYLLDHLLWPTDGPLATDAGADRIADRQRPNDLKPAHDASRDGPATAKCGGTAKLVLAEVATGQPDYLALKNTSSSLISLGGFRLEMMGIGLVSYAFKAGDGIGAGKTLYVYEYSSGQATDINTGGNVPFYDNLDSNSVALWDPSGNLLDFVAVGDSVVWLPAGASITAVPWPTGYDPKTQSFQRVAEAGACPAFKASDWAAKPITRP